MLTRNLLFSRSKGARLRIARAVLETVFDECDRFDDVETGGRLVGTYQDGPQLIISVTGTIDAGPKAKRARTSFFQDGEYQEGIFRKLEAERPDIEHLGTWHTHHVNGLDTLSGGDIETYGRTVNHPQHNLNFWYALLVTRKVGGAKRYLVRHYLFRRGDQQPYEIPERFVEILDSEPARTTPANELTDARMKQGSALSVHASNANLERRGTDDRVLKALFPEMQAYVSKAANCLYWKGPVQLVDGSTVDVIVQEQEDESAVGVGYHAALANGSAARLSHAKLHNADAPWLAARQLEVELNRSIVSAIKLANSKRGGRLWK